jgi:hypothetical protein
MPWWDKGLKSVKDGAEKVSFEAQKLVRVQREEAVVSDLNSKIQTKTMEIGQLALQLQRSGALADPAVAALAEEISAMEAQVQQQQEKVSAIKAEQWQATEEPVAAAVPPVAPMPSAPVETSAGEPPIPPVAPAAPATDTVTCPNCHTEVRSTVTFCAECGTRLK